MRVLILGAGGIGGYLGARLLQAGADVTFLVRPARQALLRAQGLRLESPLGNATLDVQTETAETVRPDYELVILTCKAYDLATAIDAIAPGLREGGKVLPLLNGMSHMDTLDARFGASRVLGGLIGIAVTLRQDGMVHHLNDRCYLTFGDRAGQLHGWIADVADLLGEAKGLTSKLVPDITRHMWQKLVTLGTLASTGVLLRGTVGEILSSREGAALIRRVLENAVETATRLGFPPDDNAVANVRAMISDPTSKSTASMLRDLEGGAQVEGDHITGHLLASARQAGVDDTLFAAAYAALKTYEARREARRLPPPVG